MKDPIQSELRQRIDKLQEILDRLQEKPNCGELQREYFAFLVQLEQASATRELANAIWALSTNNAISSAVNNLAEKIRLASDRGMGMHL